MVPQWRAAKKTSALNPTSASRSQLSARARVAAGSVLMVASRVAVLGCGLVLMGYLTRRLGLADYGRYALSILLMNWIGVSIGLATGGALVRLVAGRADGHRFAVSMLQLVTLVSGGLGILLFAGAV